MSSKYMMTHLAGAGRALFLVGALALGCASYSPSDRSEDLIETGQRVYQLCKACHTVDGTILIGPSFLGLYGSQEQVELHPNGRGYPNPEIATVTVDDDYIIESIRTPNVKVVVGPMFMWGAMTPFDERMIPDERLPAIIEYIKSLQDGH